MTSKKQNPMIRVCLALAMAGSLAACEDVPPPPKKVTPSSVVTPTEVTPTPAAPPPVAPPPVAMPTTTPEAKVETKTDDKPVGLVETARKLLDEGDVEKGLAVAQSAIDKFPRRSAAWNVLGRAQMKSGKRKDAIESFGKAIDLNPKNGFARNNLGLALIYDHRYEDAVDALEEAVELEPVMAYTWNNLGMAYEQLDRLDDAREAYGKAAEMKSELAAGSLARLKGVESLVRTAKAEPQKKNEIDKTPTPDTTAPDKTEKDPPSSN